MLAILEQLLVIQDRDRRISQIKSELRRIPEQAAAVDTRVKEEAAKLETAKTELKHLEAERKKLEIDAESKRVQIAKYRMQLGQIKSNTEYQALLKEISKLEADIRAVEDHELEFMEKTEQLQPLMREEQALLKELTSNAETEKADLKKRQANLEQELQKLQSDRTALAQQIDADVLARYEKLIRSKGDMAIVPVQGGNCGGCHLHIPPQLVHDARGSDELVSCEYCGRILYWPRN